MKTHRFANLFVVLLLVWAVGCSGCTTQQEVSQELDVKQIEAAVMDAARAFEQAEKDRDVDRLLSYLHPDFYMYQDGKRVGYDDVVTQMNETMPTLQSFEPRFEDLEVQVLNSDAALMSLRFFDKIVDQDGNESQMWGPTTFLWKLSAGKWKIAYADSDHYPTE